MIEIQRSTTSYGVSIATGLALESLFEPTTERYDNERVIPNNIDLKEYDCFYVSINSLVRNIVKSYKSDEWSSLNKNELYLLLEYEVDVIKSLVKENSIGIDLVFYHCTYKFFKSNIKNPLLRERTANTNKQMLEQNLIETVCDIAVKKLEGIKNSSRVNTVSKRVLMLTSNTVDLVDHEKFIRLSLLESTTGLLKDKEQFYTRYFNGKSLYPIPLIWRLLVVYGDNHMFRPTDLKIRNEFMSLAVKMNWTPLTTTTKVIHDVNTYMLDRALVDLFALI